MHELGIKRWTSAFAVLAIGLVPAAVALGLGVSPATAAYIGGATLIIALGVLALLARHVRGHVVAPQFALLGMLDDLSKGVAVHRAEEIGVPLIDEISRRLHLASATVEVREAQSMTKLVSVESAFDHVHSVIQSLTEGVIVVDRGGRVVLTNGSARRFLSEGEKPVEGSVLSELLTGELQGAVEAGLRRTENPRSDGFRAANIKCGSRTLDVAIAHVSVKTKGNDLGRVIVLVDETRRHEVSRLKDEFLSSVSHELRTPLTNICAFTWILNENSSVDEEQWKEFLEIVTQESVRMKQLIDDVLAYNEVVTGDVKISIAPCDLRDLLRDSAEAVAVSADRKNITVDHVVPDDRVTVEIDAEKVSAVLERLLDNALKFTPMGGRIRIVLTLTGDLVEIRVCDSGEGIAPECREAVFDKFAQLGDLMTDKPGGMGLGLPICRRLVELLGGHIACGDSDLGGASFQIVLPATASKPTASAGV